MEASVAAVGQLQTLTSYIEKVPTKTLFAVPQIISDCLSRALLSENRPVSEDIFGVKTLLRKFDSKAAP